MNIYLTILIIFTRLNLIKTNNYSDACYYVDYHFHCGDICVNDLTPICNCGNEQLLAKLADTLHTLYCCTPPSVKCKKTWYGASCPEGEVLEA